MSSTLDLDKIRKKFTVVMGPVTHLSESKMRELGWQPL